MNINMHMQTHVHGHVHTAIHNLTYRQADRQADRQKTCPEGTSKMRTTPSSPTYASRELSGISTDAYGVKACNNPDAYALHIHIDTYTHIYIHTDIRINIHIIQYISVHILFVTPICPADKLGNDGVNV